MKNRLTALFAALLLSGAFYLLLAGLVDRGWPLDDVLLLAVAATLTLSTLAGALAYRAWLHSLRTRGEFQRLAVSVDTAFRDLERRADGNAFSMADLNELVSSEVERLGERLRANHPVARPAIAEAHSHGSAIVPLPGPRRIRREPLASPPEIDLAKGQAIRRMIASGHAELSLQPIIAISRGAAVGFDVYAHIDLGDGRWVDLRGAAGLVRDSELAAFERCLVLSAAQAARRRLGDAGETMPLHVAISAALLGNEPELAAVLDPFRQYPTLTQSLVLSLPVELVEQAGTGIDRLSAAGLRLAAEGRTGDAARLRRHGVEFLKLPASSLTSAARGEKSSQRVRELLERSAAASLELIATDVTEDDQAIALLDLGVNLMSGLRFSGPKLLRATNPIKTGRISSLQTSPPAHSAG